MKPQNIIKHLYKSVRQGLPSNSSKEEIFDETKVKYLEALEDCTTHSKY